MPPMPSSSGRCWPIDHRRGLATLLLLLGCKAQEDSFYQRTFACDTNLPQATCGTNRAGHPMTCFAGRQLGSRDFCVEQCDDDAGQTPAPAVCLASRAQLVTCRPSAGRGMPGACAGDGMSCYRTDLLEDQGLCLAMNVCREDTDCRDPARSTCLGSVVRQIYPEAGYRSDGLHCLQAGCRETLSACPSGEVCLASLIPASRRPPDICVPHCDSSLNCPPNFVCLRKLSPASVAACVPATVGFRCTTAMDCLIGDCADTGEGFRLCSAPCAADADCVRFNDEFTQLVCVANHDGPGRHCVSPNAFAGSACARDDQCPAGQRCFFESPYQRTVAGECRPPCDDQGGCPARGGVAHVCLALGAERSCYPGRFGLPCADSAQCLAALGCFEVPFRQTYDSERSMDAPPAGGGVSRICTLPCATDEDCDRNAWTGRDGYCDAGFCRLGGGPGTPCSRDVECRNRICGRDAGPEGLCG
jgi:hypothetical protein